MQNVGSDNRRHDFAYLRTFHDQALDRRSHSSICSSSLARNVSSSDAIRLIDIFGYGEAPEIRYRYIDW